MFNRELLTVFGWLQSNGYLEQMVPPDSANGRWRPAGYRLTEKWQLWQLVLQQTPHDPQEVQARTCREKAALFVELRDKGKRLRLRKSGQKKFSEALLKAYESEINAHRYSLGSTLIPPFFFSLTRIYSRGSYDYGGRFYSYFQTYRSQLRLHLKIDGEPVCEVDYRYLHPSLLYLKEGLELQHDPYDIEGFPRSVAKVGFQILLNSTKVFPPVSSLAYFLNRNKHGKKARNDPQWQALTFDSATCARLAVALKTRNEAIAHHFCKGKGLEL